MDIEEDIKRIQRELVGPRYEGATLANVSFGEQTAETLKWFKEKKGFMVILGSPGCGKTYFCAAMIPWVHKKVRSYRYWKEGDLFKRIRASISEGFGDYLEQMKYFTDDEFLMIDDLGSGNATQWKSEVLFELVDNRYLSKNPTIFTSNLNREQLTSAIGERGVSRLFAKENTILEMYGANDLREYGK